MVCSAGMGTELNYTSGKAKSYPAGTRESTRK
jgi:hypothetical protein